MIATDGGRCIEYDSGSVMNAPAGAMGRRAISPLCSGIAWWARDQEMAGVRWRVATEVGGGKGN
jgi:hypothetical protein